MYHPRHLGASGAEDPRNVDRAAIDRLLDFWFGPLGDDGTVDREHRVLWFYPSEDFDQRCREGFAGDLARAARGDLDPWASTPHGRLALIILLDQFSRNIYRGTARAFAQDAKAFALCEEGVADGMDRALRPAERLFFYLPLEHAEDITLQRLSVETFRRLCRAVAPAWRKDYESFLDYAQRHHDIIARFGRFPHRNAALERPSTPEEIEFLKQPGSSF